MTLVQAWMDSLTLLKPKNFQLFVVETLTSLRDTYKLMFKYWWWAWIMAIGCNVIFAWFASRSSVEDYAGFGARWLYQLLLFATCLAARPSIMQKNCAYFRSYMYGFIYTAICLAVLPISAWPTAVSPWYIFLMLFFLDSEGGPKNFLLSMWYALKIIIFNFPLLAIISICFYLPGSLFFVLAKRGIMLFVFEESMMAQVLINAWLISTIVGIVLLPIGVCTYANIYIKKLNDQSDLYPKPVQQ